jgi:hypothetical protein
MTHFLPLLNGDTTLESALASEDDMRVEIAYRQINGISKPTWMTIARILKFSCHFILGLQGLNIAFNVCAPVYVDDWVRSPRKRVLIRYALPFKLAESQCPGNVEETLRCEAATFIWIKQYCPEKHARPRSSSTF